MRFPLTPVVMLDTLQVVNSSVVTVQLTPHLSIGYVESVHLHM
jgi:hypothetical protein